MTRSEWFQPKWLWMKRFALLGVVGAILLAAAVVTDTEILALGFLLLTPLIFWVAFIPVLHWKDRYIGRRGNVWGAFLVFETSSWSKLVYWYVHVLPDWRRSGHYTDAP